MKSYFISGASSGLGAEMARQLAARGDSVALAARRADRLAALAAELRGGPGLVTTYELDVTEAAAVDDVVRRADHDHRGLDVVVINAGRGGGRSLGKGGLSENRAVLETNLLGALAQAESALTLFRARGQGHLVLVSSLAAVRGLPRSAAAYVASKAALTSIGESLRTEFGGSGIDVTTLRPGYIRTEINADARFPWMTPVEKGAAAMIAAMDRRASDVVVPAWPWRPLGWVLKALPSAVVRRFV